MATSVTLPTTPSSTTSSSSTSVDTAVSQPPNVDLRVFRASDRGKSIRDWCKASYTTARDQQQTKRSQWNLNLAKALGEQHVKLVRRPGTDQLGLEKVITPGYRAPTNINLVRSFARTEDSKFISAFPTVVSVPASGEDQDQRSAYAAQQVWESYSASKQLRREYAKAMWWRVRTGTGYLKTWWDPLRKNYDETEGDVAYSSVTPFHLFVPNLRDEELEDQPYVVEAQVRPLQWAKHFFAEQLKGEQIKPSASAQVDLMDDAYVTLKDSPAKANDQILLLEYWIKPGATDLLPTGALVIVIEDIIVHFQEGLPYKHGWFPYTKFDHLSTGTFYADSPIVDVIPLADEYNAVRGQIRTIGNRMGNPQWIVQEGSFDPNKMTNAPGSLNIYRMGFQPPQQVPPVPLPEYMLQQQDRILSDIEDLTGQHEVSKGSAPAGISAGTALAFLKESDDNFLTPQHHNTEEGLERIAVMTLTLFNQYVDTQRKIRVVGADGSFDTELLSGADIADGLDVRVEEGSSIGQSMAAKRAQVMDLVDRQLIDPTTALKMMEIGGVQKVLDLVNVSEKQAQRENIKMKMLNAQLIEQSQQQFIQQVSQSAQQAGMDPNTPEAQQMMLAAAPSLIAVNDYDMHEVHIETHNRFRMSQEYETLPDEVKQEFAKHVQQHQMYLQQVMYNQQMSQAGPMQGPVPPDAGGAPPPEPQGQPTSLEAAGGPEPMGPQGM